MRGKALAVLCWLAINEACVGTVIKLGLRDNEGAESAPRLYRNAPFGVYASAAPHGAYSFHVPSTFVPKPTTLVPVKQESIVVQASNAYLKDSYGNRFVETPQTVAYKTLSPQQFVQLQHLPLHLSQPLSAAPSYHFPQGPPQAFFGAQYRIPSADAVSSSLPRYGVSQPFVYGGGVKSLTPASDQQFNFGSPVKAQQDSNNNQKVIYSTQGYNQLHEEPKFQRLQAKPVAHHNEQHQVAPQQIQVAPSTRAQVSAPIKHAVKTVHNGKETIVHLETKPPLPLLDLSLLEPLTFANPIVPQVQHYLPKINSVTYQKLPLADVEEVKKHNNEFVIQKTKSYDSGLIKGKPHKDEPKKKQKKPPKKDTDVYVHYETKSEKPSIKVKGKPNDPEYSYEIKSPNYKETYNEQVVSYNKETQSDPVSYSYQKESQKKPISYSFSHSSKDPGQTKKVQYVKKDPVPNHLIHKFQPGEQDAHHRVAPSASPEPEGDDSAESSDDDDDSQVYDHAQYTGEHDKPSHSHSSSHSHHSNPSSHSHQSDPAHNHHSHQSHPQSSTHSHHPSTHSHHSTKSHHPSTQSHHHSSQSHHPSTQSYHHSSHSVPSTHSHYSGSSHPSSHSHQAHPQHLKAEHREQENHSPNPVHYTVSPKPTQYYSHAPSAAPELQPLQEFMENLRFIPSYASAAIRVDPNQHVQKPQQKQQPQFFIQAAPHARSEGHVSSEPIIYEKSKKIIIQEESPDEVHSHQEKITAQMVGQEENNENSEKDFEKSYKEAAYGFPAYDRDSSENEDEIYNPENYGVPHHSGEDTGHSTFEQYQEEGDEFPKFSRLGYKDSRDKMKENYFLDYSVHKPESMTDRYQSKIDYYKMFLKHKPEHHKVHESEDKKKQSAKYTVPPSFFDSEPRQKSKQSAQYKTAPAFEYDYLKDSRDSSAHASRPNLRYKSRTHFVEPQFQYGFEPIAIPRLDSELDTMASNVSPESEKPGTRKKVYKENWYIKKTSTSSKPSS